LNFAAHTGYEPAELFELHDLEAALARFAELGLAEHVKSGR